MAGHEQENSGVEKQLLSLELIISQALHIHKAAEMAIADMLATWAARKGRSPSTQKRPSE